MANSERAGTLSQAETVRRLTRPLVAALVTGVADPPPEAREWPPGLRWTRWIGVGRMPFDAAVVTVDLLIGWIVLGGTYGLLGGSLGPIWLLVAAALGVPVVLRNWYPVAAWRMTFIAMLFASTQDYLTTPYVPGGVVAALLCLYSVAVRSPREVTFGVGALSVGSVWILDQSSAVPASVLILVPVLLGHSVRQRRLAQRQLAEQVRRHQESEAVLTERQRIARELHDVVAHHMSMIAIQAEAAPYTVPEIPGKIRNDLAEIRATALEALTELRRILGVLRSEDAAGETAPQPGLDRLDELVAGARGTGLTVETVVTGEPPVLPSGVGLSAYRIVQEALSNAMRHAPGSHVRVEIGYGRSELNLRVVNGPPPGGPPHSRVPGTGHGLIGMRERVAMLGGELTAKPTLEGFVVAAMLPLRDTSAQIPETALRRHT